MRPNSVCPEQATPGLWYRATPLFALAALMLLTRPFHGIFHDGYLYAAQTLNRLGGSAISNDLIFTFGNQDSFTIFTILYAPVVAALGLPTATMLFWGLGMICWGAALTVLTGKLFSDPQARMMAIAAAILLAPNYGNGILSYAEPSVTPRPFAEALGMLAITTSLKRNRWLSGFLVLATGLLHPLTGIGVAALCAWLSVTLLRQFVAIAVSGGVLALALAVFAGPPFDGLLQRVDPDWLRLMHDQSALVFVSTWVLNGLAVVMLPLTALSVILWYGPAHHARLARAVLLVAGALLALSALGADLLANRLITMLQLWRAMIWPVLLGNLLTVSAVMVLPKPSLARGLLILTLILNTVEHLLGILPATSAISAGLVLAALLIDLNLPPRAARWGGAACAVLASFVSLAVLTLLFNRVTGNIEQPPDVMTLLRLGIVGLAMLALLNRVPRPLAGAAGVAALAMSVWLADARTPWQRFVDEPEPLPEEITQAVAGRQIYWENALDLMWFKLGQPQFYSCRQKAGGVFFRGQAQEVANRAGVLRTLNGADFADDASDVCPLKQNPGKYGPDTAEQFKKVCRALPELDLIVMRTGLHGLFRARWELPVQDRRSARDLPPTTIFHVYDCADFRP